MRDLMVEGLEASRKHCHLNVIETFSKIIACDVVHIPVIPVIDEQIKEYEKLVETLKSLREMFKERG